MLEDENIQSGDAETEEEIFDISFASEVSESDPSDENQESEEIESEEEIEVVEGRGKQEKESAQQWVKDLRKSQKELKRKNRELEERLKASAPVVREIVLERKPTIDDCDDDIDVFAQALDNWHNKKASFDAQNAAKIAKGKEAEKAWQNQIDSYQKQKEKLKLRDFPEAEENVLSSLSIVQQGIILQGSDAPAALIYALGKDEDLLKSLSEITDIAKFSFKVARLEAQMKIEKRKPSTSPEKKVSGSAPSSLSGANKIESARKLAEKTGDYTEVIRLKRALRTKT